MTQLEPIIQQRQKNREALFTHLYREVFPAVAAYISKKGGTLDQARDIFQEGLIIFYEKVIIDGFETELTNKAYLFGISRNLWIKSFNRQMKMEPVDQLDLAEKTENLPSTDQLLEYLKAAGQKCLDLLQSFYYEKLPMKALAERFGYTNDRSATVQKYKCLEKVREEIKSKSLNYEDFLA